MTSRYKLALYFAYRFVTKQWWDIFYWSGARITHSLMRLKRPDRLTNHQLLSLLSWHAHQTEKATKHRSADPPAKKPRGFRHFDALGHYLAEADRRADLQGTDAATLAWIRDIYQAYEHWRATPGWINITAPDDQTRHPTDGIAAADVATLIERRTSARVWKPIAISDEIINSLIDAGLQAPSSCNRQGVVITVAENTFPRTLKEGVNNAFMLNNAAAIFYIANDPSLYPERQAPALDAGMAAQNILLLAEAHGLSGCAMYHSESFDQKALRQRLGISRNLYIYVALLIGYPEEVAIKPRRMSHAIRARRVRNAAE